MEHIYYILKTKLLKCSCMKIPTFATDIQNNFYFEIY